MFILSSGFFGLAGPGFAGWLPALAETVWLAGASWAILPLVRRAGWPRPRLLSLIMGSLGLLVLLSSTPNLFQSFFWQAGLLTYSFPLIGLTFSGGIILRAWLHPKKSWGPVIGGFLLAFMCGGFSESFDTMQVTLFALVLLVILIWGGQNRRRSLLPVVGAFLAGALLAMLIVAIAPGNQVRQEAVGVHAGLVRIITFSMRNAAFIYAKYFIFTPFWAFLSISLPFFTGWLFASAGKAASHDQRSSLWWQQSWLRWLLGLGLASFILVTAACAPVVYAMNAYPDERTIIIPQFVIATTVISASAWLGMGLRSRYILPDPWGKPVIGRVLQAGFVAILILGAGYSIGSTVTRIPDFQAYARAWDQREAVLKQAVDDGQQDVTVVGLNARFGIADLNESPDNWVNRCMASYYDIRNLRGR